MEDAGSRLSDEEAVSPEDIHNDRVNANNSNEGGAKKKKKKKKKKAKGATENEIACHPVRSTNFYSHVIIGRLSYMLLFTYVDDPDPLNVALFPNINITSFNHVLGSKKSVTSSPNS